MAVKMNVDTGKQGFFKHVLQLHPQEMGQAIALMEMGVEFDIQLFALKAINKTNGKAYQVAMKTSTSNMMKAQNFGQADPVIASAASDIANFIQAVYKQVVGGKASTVKPAPKSSMSFAGKTAEEVFKDVDVLAGEPKPINIGMDFSAVEKHMAQGIHDSMLIDTVIAEGKKAKAGVLDSFSSPNKPLMKAGVIPLVQAEAIGQKCKGTSGGSIYIAIAINPRVKVATRVQGSAISLRVECNNPTSAEMKAIQESGIKWNGNYGSMHMDAGGIPVRRVLGAYMYGMGIKFDRQLQAGEEVLT